MCTDSASILSTYLGTPKNIVGLTSLSVRSKEPYKAKVHTHTHTHTTIFSVTNINSILFP